MAENTETSGAADAGHPKRAALVTGASRGIGARIATRFALAGIQVALNFRSNPDAAEQAMAEITKGGGEGFLVEGDVSSEESAQGMVQSVIDRYGHIDVLVNNAGINKDRLLLRMDPDDWDQVLDVNLRGAFLCTKYAMPHMIRQRRGRIVNISSVVGLSGNPGQANYAAAKAGLIGFTKAVAREVASRNVTVNAVAPGYITTGMVEGLSPDTRKRILDRIPMGRFGAADEVAEAVLFLCGEGAGYITGQVLTIDGGLIA